MTADEREKIGILIGTVNGLEKRLGKIEETLFCLDNKLDEMKEHVAPVAAQLAKELASYKVEEAKYKVDVIGPMKDTVDSDHRWRLALVAVSIFVGGLGGLTLGLLEGLSRLHDLFN